MGSPPVPQVHGLCVRRPCRRLLAGISAIMSRTAEPDVRQITVEMRNLGGNLGDLGRDADLARAADGDATLADGASRAEARAERKGKAPMLRSGDLGDHLGPSSAVSGRDAEPSAEAARDCAAGARRVNGALACTLVVLMVALFATWM